MLRPTIGGKTTKTTCKLFLPTYTASFSNLDICTYELKVQCKSSVKIIVIKQIALFFDDLWSRKGPW